MKKLTKKLKLKLIELFSDKCPICKDGNLIKKECVPGLGYTVYKCDNCGHLEHEWVNI